MIVDHDTISSMPLIAPPEPTQGLRDRTIEWKRESLAQVKGMISSLQKIERELGKIYGVVKSNVKSIHNEARGLYKEHEKKLEADEEEGDEEEDDYDNAEEVMSALENI